MFDEKDWIAGIQQGDPRVVAKAISLVENGEEVGQQILQHLPLRPVPVIGITGPPGAGKSTLVDALIQEWTSRQKKIAVVCVDPSSPYHHGALLGDRIRMNRWYDHPNVFIRSLASRGALGGLHPKIIEITDVLKAASFDLILIETVGVGQSEIEIAGLADVTAVVLVPESGDEIQTLKAGLYEIASLFIVNKSDRPGAELFTKHLITTLSSWGHPGSDRVPVLQTIALQHQGISELIITIEQLLHTKNNLDEKAWLLAQKAYYLIQEKRMKDISKARLQEQIRAQLEKGPFNIYAFCQNLA